MYLRFRSRRIHGARWWMPTSRTLRACPCRATLGGGTRFITMVSVGGAYGTRAAPAVVRIAETQSPPALFATCGWVSTGANLDQDRARLDQALQVGGVRRVAGERPGVRQHRVTVQPHAPERETEEVVRRRSGVKGEARGAPPRVIGPSQRKVGETRLGARASIRPLRKRVQSRQSHPNRRRGLNITPGAVRQRQSRSSLQ